MDVTLYRTDVMKQVSTRTRVSEARGQSSARFNPDPGHALRHEWRILSPRNPCRA
jgi:hypothetical protein